MHRILLLLLLSFPVNANHVIHISIDGLRGDSADYSYLKQPGAYTSDARTDDGNTSTMPNHTGMITGLPVSEHKWTPNGYDPNSSETIHSRAGKYIESTFDRVHAVGMSTSLYINKTKLTLFNNSYPIDEFYSNQGSAQTLVDNFIDDLANNERHYAFLHIRTPDSEGHRTGWSLSPSSGYQQGVQWADDDVRQVFDFVQSHPVYAGKTAFILSSDHGGTLGTTAHHTGTSQDKQIPFIVYCPGNSITVPALTRNYDAANLALRILKLDTIDGATDPFVNSGAEHCIGNKRFNPVPILQTLDIL